MRLLQTIMPDLKSRKCKKKASQFIAAYFYTHVDNEVLKMFE